MNRQISRIGALTCAAAMVLAAGCANSKRERTLETGVSSMNNVNLMLDRVNARIDSTYEAMNALEVQGVDHRAAAADLDEQVRLLNQAADEVRDEGRRMRSLGDDYFVEWEREHARTAGRGSDAVSVSQAERQSYNRVTEATEIVSQDFRTLSESLRELQAEVADGFTQAELAPLVERTNMRAIDTRNAIEALQAEFERIIGNYRMQYGR